MFRLYETNAVPTLNRYITLARFYVYIYLSDLQVFTHMLNEREVYKRRYKSSLGENAMNLDCAISAVCLRAMPSKAQIKPDRSVIYTTILLEFNLYPALLLKKCFWICG